MKPKSPPQPRRLMDDIQRELERAESPNAPMQRRINELFSETHAHGLRGWAYLANCLFFAISRHHTPATARKIFNASGPAPKRLTTALRNATVLERFDRMKPKPNMARLARELAEENNRLPKERRRGSGGTDPGNLKDHIRDLRRARDKTVRANKR